MRPVSRIIYFSTVTINCISDVGDKSEENYLRSQEKKLFQGGESGQFCQNY